MKEFVLNLIGAIGTLVVWLILSFYVVIVMNGAMALGEYIADKIKGLFKKKK